MKDRRRFLQRMAAAGVVAGSAQLLAGCEDDSASGKKSLGSNDASGGQDTLPADTLATEDAAAGSDVPVKPPKTYDDKAVVSDSSPESLPQSSSRFALGIQAGAMRDDEAMLWSHAALEDTDTGVELLVWRPGPTAEQIYVAVQTAVEPLDGFVHQLVTPLLPDTWYSYCLVALGPDGAVARSAIGRFRTAFEEGAKKLLHIAGTACTRQNYAPFPALTKMAKAEPDVLCHMGDMVYADGSKNAANYRSVWKTALQTSGYKAILTACGQYRTWDDHEVTDNSVRYTMPAALKQTAIDSFFEHAPFPRLGGDRFYDSYRWGDTAEFFVLDCRNERKAETREGPNAEYISTAQMTWLQEALSQSPCHFKVILNSVPITAMPPVWPFGPDRWQGYPAQRQALLDHITGKTSGKAIKGVWFLTGDFHLGLLMRLSPEGSGPESAIHEVMMGPGGNANTIVQGVLSDPDAGPDFVPTSQFLHVGSTPAATRLYLDPIADTVRVVFEDASSGKVQYDQVLPGGGA